LNTLQQQKHMACMGAQCTALAASPLMQPAIAAASMQPCQPGTSRQCAGPTYSAMTIKCDFVRTITSTASMQTSQPQWVVVVGGESSGACVVRGLLANDAHPHIVTLSSVKLCYDIDNFISFINEILALAQQSARACTLGSSKLSCHSNLSVQQPTDKHGWGSLTNAQWDCTRGEQ